MDGFPLQHLLRFVDLDTSLCCRSALHGLGIQCKKWNKLDALLQGNDIRGIFRFAYRNGSLKLAKYCLLKEKFDQLEMNCGLRDACKVCGGKALAELMIFHGANDWNGGLYNACFGGCKELAELMISKGAIGWDNGLCDACASGHKELAELMISKGATDWSHGLCYACMGGYKELAELMISKGATDWDNGLYCACSIGCKELVKLLISHGATDCGNCGESMQSHLN
jgi:hypothetical protein